MCAYNAVHFVGFVAFINCQSDLLRIYYVQVTLLDNWDSYYFVDMRQLKIKLDNLPKVTQLGGCGLEFGGLILKT